MTLFLSFTTAPAKRLYQILRTGRHSWLRLAKPVEKPSVKEKLDRYKAQAKQQKEAERKEPEVKKDGKNPQQKNGQTVHRQPKKKPKTKER